MALSSNGRCGYPSEELALLHPNPFMYPKDTNPLDVLTDKPNEVKKLPKGTWIFFLMYELIPLLMGILILLFYFATVSYLFVSTLRLFYLDNLKPYKSKALKGLGKHHAHRTTERKQRMNKRWKKLLPTINTQEVKDDDEGETRTVSRTGSEKPKRRIIPGPSELMHPPGMTLSYTSPPMPNIRGPGQGAPAIAAGYPHVIDLLDAKNLPSTDRFPSSQNPSQYIVGLGAKSRAGSYHWNPKWYKGKQTEESEARIDLDRIRSTMSRIHTTASEKFDIPYLPPPTAQHQVRLPQPRPMIQQPTKPQPPQQEPTPPSGTAKGKDIPLDRPMTPSRAELFERYTFLHPSGSNSFTAIPKTTSYKQQLAVLRGGPRKDQKEIKKEWKDRRTRKSELEEAREHFLD